MNVPEINDDARLLSLLLRYIFFGVSAMASQDGPIHIQSGNGTLQALHNFSLKKILLLETFENIQYHT